MITIKLWCTKCDHLLENKEIALDSPVDGRFMICPKCKHRIIIFIEGPLDDIKTYISSIRIKT